MTLPGHASLDLVAAPNHTGLHQVKLHRLDPQSRLSTHALIRTCLQPCQWRSGLKGNKINFTVDIAHRCLPCGIRAAKQVLMRISGIDHVVIRVADLDRSIAFYCDVLGCTLDWRRDEIGLAHLRVGTSFIDLLAAESVLPEAARNMDHLCLTVPDFDPEQVRQHLQDHGVAAGPAAER